MTVKLVLLKCGEDIIADIQEMIVENNVVGYFFENPCSVKILAQEISTDENKKPAQLQLTPWMPLSNDPQIPVPSDWLVTMVEPIPQLKEMYENGVLKNGKGNQSDSSDEQSDSDQSD